MFMFKFLRDCQSKNGDNILHSHQKCLSSSEPKSSPKHHVFRFCHFSHATGLSGNWM
jgi:hypothetical protein